MSIRTSKRQYSPLLLSLVNCTTCLSSAANKRVNTSIYYLVDVHVGLRARAGLKDDKREMAVQLSRHYFLGSCHNGYALQ